MDLKWRSTSYGNWQLWWYEKHLRCAEVSRRDSDRKWRLTISYNVAPMDFTYDLNTFDTPEEAMEYAENLVRVLIIGGHHEHL